MLNHSRKIENVVNIRELARCNEIFDQLIYTFPPPDLFAAKGIKIGLLI